MERDAMFIGLIFSVMAVIIGVVVACGTVFWVLVRFS
jgi:hypothetical protein